MVENSQHISETEETGLENLMENYEKNLIISFLKKNHWNCSEAASKMGIHRSVLYKKIKKYNIEKE